MSPYRVVLTDGAICAAMVSTDKQTGAKRIYIIQKTFIPELTEEENLSFTEKDIAYAMSTRRNSCIVDTYWIYRESDVRMYSVFRMEYGMQGASSQFVAENLRTLFECQMVCMEHFCERNGHTIDRIL